MIAPMVAVIIVMIMPPPMPMRLASQPPTIAPAIPIRIVTMIPPGSSPGMISLASAPAINPMIIHPSIAIIGLLPPLGQVRLSIACIPIYGYEKH
jgi:hypothetical protein